MPLPITSRPYTADDLPNVVDLLIAHLAAGGDFRMSLADLRQVLSRRSVGAERQGRVWERSDGGMVGFGFVWPPHNTVFTLVHPSLDEGAADPPLLEQIVQWAVEHGRAIARERGEATAIRFRPLDGERALIELIGRYGFQAEDWYTARYTRSLAEPIPPPRLPPGFTIRHVAGEAEVQAYVALHREAFGTENMQVEERIAFMRDPDYVPELDLVAVAPDGTLASFVVGGIDREESRLRGRMTGYTDPLGTRPAYRRQGLARALLLEALGRLRGRGVQEVSVGTGSWNAATMRLVESVGYRLDRRLLAYAREIRGSDGPAIEP